MASLSFYDEHLAWVQRVNHELSDTAKFNTSFYSLPVTAEQKKLYPLGTTFLSAFNRPQTYAEIRGGRPESKRSRSSKASSRISSARSSGPSFRSSVTEKKYIEELQSLIDLEREKRASLQKELETLRRLKY